MQGGLARPSRIGQLRSGVDDLAGAGLVLRVGLVLDDDVIQPPIVSLDQQLVAPASVDDLDTIAPPSIGLTVAPAGVQDVDALGNSVLVAGAVSLLPGTVPTLTPSRPQA